MKETLRQQQAFEYYYMLGPNRSLGKVSRQFGVSSASVSIWARNFRWNDRLEERDTKNMATIRAANDEQVIQQMEQYRRIINESVQTYIQGLKDKKLKVETVSDFARLVRLDMELCGYVADAISKDGDENTSSDININLTIKGDTDDC